MADDLRKSVSVAGKEHGLSGQMMHWLLKTQGRMVGTPGHFYASAKYKQYEHPIRDKRGFSYDPEFFKGIDYSQKALDKAFAEWDRFKTKQGEYSEASMGNSTSSNEASSAGDGKHKKRGFFARLFGK